MKGKVQNVKLALLVEDMELYPRENVSSSNVARLREAIRIGEDIGEIIADEKTKIIVDGFHRRRAILKEKGKSVSWPIRLFTFPDRATMFAEAIRINTRHGMDLNQIERVKCAIRLEDLGVSREDIAQVMHVRPSKIGMWMSNKVGLYKPSNGRVQKIALKRPLFHLAGHNLTRDQVESMPSLGGNDAAFFAKQIMILLNSDGIPWHQNKIVVALLALDKTLHAALVKKGLLKK